MPVARALCPDPRASSRTPNPGARLWGIGTSRECAWAQREGAWSLTFLHAARLRRWRWDGPLEGLQDGHPGLGGGETQPGEAEKGGGVQPLHVPQQMASLNPQGPRSALRPRLSSCPTAPCGVGPPLAPGLPGKGRLRSQAQPSPSRPRAAVGDDPSSLQSRRPWSRVTLVTPGTPVSHACARPAGLQVPGAFSFSHRLLRSSLHLGAHRVCRPDGSSPRRPCAGGPFLSRVSRLSPLRRGWASCLNRRRSSHPCASPGGSLGWPALAE